MNSTWRKNEGIFMRLKLHPSYGQQKPQALFNPDYFVNRDFLSLTANRRHPCIIFFVMQPYL